MKHLNWGIEKNELLKQKRGTSFEEIAFAIQSGNLLGTEENPNYPNQKMYIIEIKNYAVVVPFVETKSKIFLKAAFPSHKYTKRYRLGAT